MTLDVCYLHRYALNGVDAVYLETVGGEPLEIAVIFEDAGQNPDETGTWHRAVLKVLKSEFPEVPPVGATFTLSSQEWTVIAPLGKADGTNRHQWAVLVGRDKQFRMKGKA